MNDLTRRDFIATAAVGASVVALGSAESIAQDKKRKIKLGFDNFSIRAMGWKAPQLIDYAAKQKVDVLLMSDLGVYENFDEPYLADLRKKADDLGLELHAGTGGICPSSNAFRDTHGTAEEHLALTVRVAKALGSPVARCYLGNSRDRQGDGGIYRHIENTVNVCKAVRSQAVDAGVKVAIENHAGDLQAWELCALIEAAGTDYVGATIDSGNATWTLEDPLVNLEVLGKYAVSSGIRDSAIWESEDGARVEWTNMGDGDVDWNAYLDLWEKTCPDCPVIMEIISGIGARNYPYFTRDFWGPYERVRASEFSQFAAMAKRGKPFTAPEDRPKGERSPELEQKQQLFDLEQSLKYCKEILGIGLKA